MPININPEARDRVGRWGCRGAQFHSHLSRTLVTQFAVSFSSVLSMMLAALSSSDTPSTWTAIRAAIPKTI